MSVDRALDDISVPVTARREAPAAPSPAHAREASLKRVPGLVSIGRFVREFEPPEYAIDGVLRSGSLYTLTARTGHGKTALLTGIAVAVAADKTDMVGRDVAPGRVVYLAGENPEDTRMRFMAAAYRWAVDLDRLGDRLQIVDARWKPEAIIENLKDTGPMSLVIMDTLAAFYDGQDINDNIQGGEFMRRLRPITGLKGRPTVIAAAHPRKGAPEDQLVPYGAGAILNEVDGNLTLWVQGSTTRLHWQGKIRGADFAPIGFSFEEVDSPDLVDAKGRRIKIPVTVPTTEEALEQRERETGDRKLAILRALADKPGMPLSELGAAIADPRPVSKSRVKGLLDTLERSGLADKDLAGRWRVTKKGLAEVSK